HGAGATFFVTEPACREFPHALEELRRSGQQLEAHGRWHTQALLLWPWREWQQIAWHPRPASDPDPHFYRPPYGGHSPLTRLFARLLRRQVVLWDSESRDWTAPKWTSETAAELARQTLERTRPGSVILLHDGPGVTPELLRPLLEGLAQRGWQAVRLSELPPQRIGLRDGLRRVWQSYGG
ncbi:polysaccharide deacetylase family protein, partial [Deinococcus sp.]|uniref:polysaccharide deacetylase family protein n=1 Tax=Deinococcus sp. TaxID=47478 RepID=UPI0025B8CC11